MALEGLLAEVKQASRSQRTGCFAERAIHRSYLQQLMKVHLGKGRTDSRLAATRNDLEAAGVPLIQASRGARSAKSSDLASALDPGPPDSEMREHPHQSVNDWEPGDAEWPVRESVLESFVASQSAATFRAQRAGMRNKANRIPPGFRQPPSVGVLVSSENWIGGTCFGSFPPLCPGDRPGHRLDDA